MSEKGDIYGQGIDQMAFDALLESNIASEYLRNRLLLLTAGQPLSTREMAREVGMDPRLIVPHVVALEQLGLMSMVNIEGNSPKYQRMS